VIFNKPQIIRYAVFVLLIAAMPLIFQGRQSYYLSMLSLAGIYAIVVIGLNMLMGFAGQISLGHAAFFSIGAYTTAILTTRYGLPPVACLLPAVALSGVAAFLIGLPTLKLKEHYLAMATLGVGLIVYAVIKADPGGITGGTQGIPNIPPLKLLCFATDSDASQYYVIWSIVFVIFVFSANIINSRFGRAFMAIHKSEVSAEVLGVNAFAYKMQVFILSALYAGLAGYLYAHCSPLFYLNPDDVSHFMLSIKLLTMVVIGGMSSMWGALFGAVGLSLLPEVLRLFGSFFHGVSTTDIEMAVYGIILVAVMIFLPSEKFELLKRFGKKRSRPEH